MNESHVSDRLGDHLESDLSLAERARVDAHIAECSACAEELRELRETVSLLRGLPDPHPPEHLRADVMRRIRAGEPRAPGVLRSLRRIHVPSVAAALAAGLAGLLALASSDFGAENFLGTPPDPTSERIAQRSDSALATDVRAMGARRPLPLHRAPVAVGVRSPRPQRNAVVAFETAVPFRRSVQPRRPAGIGFFATAAPEAPPQDLHAALSLLIEDQEAFLARIRRSPADGRGASFGPLLEHRRATAAWPQAIPAATR